ncbi:hypothetical protein V9T40_009589 [Parthenolecanium corni]|uniref:Uncharacterized protein n=1 Tax=Parthenolecanium corni TaxID=536013 RepID=A0AAN9Y6U9_9HEMI
MQEFERLQAEDKSTRVYLRFVGMERFVDAAEPNLGYLTTRDNAWEKHIEYQQKIMDAAVIKSTRNSKCGVPTYLSNGEVFTPQNAFGPNTATFLVQLQCVDEELADLTDDINLIFKAFLITFFLLMVYGFFCSSYVV